MFALDDLAVSIVQAPMAGGPSTPGLVHAVTRAGGLGFLAGARKTPEVMAHEISQVRRTSTRAFGVNLFVPQPPVEVTVEVQEYLRRMQAEADRYGAFLPEPDPGHDDAWDAKMDLLLSDPVPVVSFTFGMPTQAEVESLRRVGSFVIATVTCVSEARAAAELGFDALCVQGPEAGGHRGTHDRDAEPDETPLLGLLAAIRRVTPLPLVAAGGLSSGADIAAALDAGAGAVQLGTAYLRTPEAGTKPVHKDALVDPRRDGTAVTRAFSGRYARGLRNRFLTEHDASAPSAFPLLDLVTAPIRAAAAERGDAEAMSLWAGTGHAHVTDEPAEDVTRRLWHEANRVGRS
jgi:nitronate monooxygenase